MSLSRQITSVSALLAVSVHGQNTTPFPAAESVSDESISGAPSSPAERVQLTDKAPEAIAAVLPELVHLWKFDDESGEPISSGECRSSSGTSSGRLQMSGMCSARCLGRGPWSRACPLPRPAITPGARTTMTRVLLSRGTLVTPIYTILPPSLKPAHRRPLALRLHLDATSSLTNP